MTELHELSLAELARRLRSGALTATALADHAVERHARHGAVLAAYKHWDPDALRRAAMAADAALAAGADLGPLQGIPVAVKDVFGVAGMPIFAGSPRRLPPEFERDGPVVAALRRQLAPITGKTHTVEFAYDGTGANPHWGAPRNPWDASAHRLPGGSSSGAGVSLLEGSAWLALGSDSGGSVRMPASWTGTVGLKVSHGRWSIDGIVPFSPNFDSPGPLTRSAADAAFAFAALDPRVDRARFKVRCEEAAADDFAIAVCDTHFWENCAPGVAEGVRTALDALAAAGARIRPLAFPEAAEAYALAYTTRGNVTQAEFYAAMLDALPEWLPTLNPILAGRLAAAGGAEGVRAVDFLRTMATLQRLAASAAERLAGVDVLATPTIVSTPPTEAEVATLEAYRPHNLRVHQNTFLVNLLGLCAITLPVALDRTGIPVGLQLIARHGTEERLLAAAVAFERVLGTPRQRLGPPPLCP